MIRFPDRSHPEFAKLCERLQAFRRSMTEARSELYAGLAKKFKLDEQHANRAYRRARLRRRRPVKRSVW